MATTTETSLEFEVKGRLAEIPRRIKAALVAKGVPEKDAGTYGYTARIHADRTSGFYYSASHYTGSIRVSYYTNGGRRTWILSKKKPVDSLPYDEIAQVMIDTVKAEKALTELRAKEGERVMACREILTKLPAEERQFFSATAVGIRAAFPVADEDLPRVLAFMRELGVVK